jgi:hypothetical protein
MIVGLLNVGLSEEQAKEIIVEIIDKQLWEQLKRRDMCA